MPFFPAWAARACAITVLAHAMLAQTTTPPSDDAAQGKAILEGKGACQGCHRIKGMGGRLGPDLTEIGSFRSSADLTRSILDPDAEIAPQNRPFRVVTKSGETVDGKLLNQDTFTVQILDTKERLRSFAKSDLREYVFVGKSPMPSFRDRLSAEEVQDVVAYLSSLKAPDRPAGQAPGR